MAEKEKTKVKESNGTFGELKALVTDYTKQQTVEPLKHLGKWVGFGVGGGIMMIIGAFLTGLGFLRLLQKSDWFDGNLNFFPYLIMFVVLVATAVLCVVAASKTPEWLEEDA